MAGKLDNLDRGQIASFGLSILGEGHLGQTYRARVGVVGGPEKLEWGHHGARHVLGTVERAVGAPADVDVDESRQMALEPTGLEGDSASRRRPVGAVLGRLDTTA